VVSYFLRYFSSTSTEQISSDFAGPFTSFDPVGFAIFATHARGAYRSSTVYQLGLWLAIFAIFHRLPPNKFLRFRRTLSPVSIRLALLFLLLTRRQLARPFVKWPLGARTRSANACNVTSFTADLVCHSRPQEN
jgi:hypothetical protein